MKRIMGFAALVLCLLALCVLAGCSSGEAEAPSDADLTDEELAEELLEAADEFYLRLCIKGKKDCQYE